MAPVPGRLRLAGHQAASPAGPVPPAGPAPPAGPEKTGPGRPSAAAGPLAVFGDFNLEPPAGGCDPDRRPWTRGPSRAVVLSWFALTIGVAVLVAALLWSDFAPIPGQTSAALGPGSCLASSSGRSVVVIDCGDPDVEFTVAATYPGATDADRCNRVSSDLMLVTRDDVVLCLNYRAVAGECLYAGEADDVGKAPCRMPVSASTPTGLFRVVAVLPRTVDVCGCPTGTISSLVHITTPQLLCLGLP